MGAKFIKLDKTVLYVIKKIKYQNQRGGINRIFDKFTKILDFQHITKDSLSGRVNQLLKSNQLINKINRSKEPFVLNKDMVGMSIIDMIPSIQHSPSSKILDTSENLLDSFEAMPSLSMQVNLIETPKEVDDASINSKKIDQSEYFGDKTLEKAKFNRLKTIIF